MTIPFALSIWTGQVDIIEEESGDGGEQPNYLKHPKIDPQFKFTRYTYQNGDCDYPGGTDGWDQCYSHIDPLLYDPSSCDVYPWPVRGGDILNCQKSTITILLVEYSLAARVQRTKLTSLDGLIILSLYPLRLVFVAITEHLGTD